MSTVERVVNLAQDRVDDFSQRVQAIRQSLHRVIVERHRGAIKGARESPRGRC
jgi:hypothetical protein